MSMAHLLKNNIPNVQAPAGVDRVKKDALNGMYEFIVPSSGNHILDEPFPDDARAFIEFSSRFGPVSTIADDGIDFFR